MIRTKVAICKKGTIRASTATIAATAALTVAVALTAGGCSNADDLGSNPPVGGGTASGQGQGANGPDGAPAAEPDPSGSPGREDGSTDAGGVPAVSRTTEIEAAEGVTGTLEIGLAGLRVDGRLATLVLVYTPRYDEDPGGTISLFDMFARNVAEVTLVDSVNLQRYLVVEDSRGLELGPFPATVETRNNEPVSASYTFAAPPADVTTVDVYVDDRKIFDNIDVDR